MWTLIACATSSVHNDQMCRTSIVQHEILVCILSGYCSFAYRTGSPTRLEFTRIISTACDRNQLAYCSHSNAHNFAQESPIEKIKVPFWSAINELSDGVLISVSTKCSEWLVYPERVTYLIEHGLLNGLCESNQGLDHPNGYKYSTTWVFLIPLHLSMDNSNGWHHFYIIHKQGLTSSEYRGWHHAYIIRIMAPYLSHL